MLRIWCAPCHKYGHDNRRSEVRKDLKLLIHKDKSQPNNCKILKWSSRQLNEYWITLNGMTPLLQEWCEMEFAVSELTEINMFLLTDKINVFPSFAKKNV